MLSVEEFVSQGRRGGRIWEGSVGRVEVERQE